MAEQNEIMYNAECEHFDEASTSYWSSGNNDEKTFKIDTRNDNSGMHYQLYKPVPKEFVTVTLRIGESKNIPLNMYRYYVKVHTVRPEYSIEGTDGLSTQSVCGRSIFVSDWNEDLKFHIEKNEWERIKFEFSLYRTFFSPSLIDKSQVSITDMTKEKNKTVSFQNTPIQITVYLNNDWIDKDPKHDINIRNQTELCEKEKQFCEHRKIEVKKSINNLMEKAAKSTRLYGKDVHVDVPTIAVIGSGGGMRAVIGMCGALDALNELGILDCAFYIAGVSGSSWYISTLYASDDSTVDKLDTAKVGTSIEKRLQNAPQDANEVFESWKHAFMRGVPKGKYVTGTDLYGMVIGDILIDKNSDSKWSSTQKTRLQRYEVPLPLLAALHVNESVKTTEFSEWVEFSPYEVFIPKYCTGIDMEQFGSVFKGGFIIEKLDEPPLHYLQGICGSAYGAAKNVITNEAADKSLISQVKKIVSSFFKPAEDVILGKVPNWLRDMSRFTELKGFKIPKITHVQENKEAMFLTDAGIMLNSPYPLVLHPAREVDLIISFELSDLSDEKYSLFSELEKAENWATNRQIPFPSLKNKTDGTKGMYVFDGTQSSPIIIHFGIMETENNTIIEHQGERRNVFKEYPTGRFQYSTEKFQWLSSLMNSKVKANKEMIVQQIEASISRRKEAAKDKVA